MYTIRPIKAVAGFLLCSMVLLQAEEAIDSYVVKASWYKDGTITAWGDPFDPNALTCASIDLLKGTRLRISYKGSIVDVVVNDRMPYKWKLLKGREIDLSRKAFSCIAPLSKGEITVTVEILK